MAVALRMLARRSYSEGELRDRLIAKRRGERGAIEDCIGRLKQLGYLDDDLFARNYASYRVGLKPLGKKRLTRELARKKVPADAIGEALNLVFSGDAEERLIDRAINSRIRTHGRPADRPAAKRLFDHLARRGFEYDLITRKLHQLKMEIEKEVDHS